MMFSAKFQQFAMAISFFAIILPITIPNNGRSLPLQDPVPNYVFYNGTVVTMEATHPIVEAVAIMGNIISAVGDETEAFRYVDSNTELIDLQGKTLVPGFIDSHSHWIGDRGLTNTTELNDVIDSLISYGWTSISELFVNQDRLNELQAVDDANLLKVRVNCYLPLGYRYDRFGDWYQVYTPGHKYSPRLRIAGVKLFADRWYTEPEIFINQSEMYQLVQEAHTLGFQISTHSVVPNATDIVLNAYHSVIGNRTNDQRHRIEHLIILRSDQITRLAELGVLGCVQLPWFNSDWNDQLESVIERDWAVMVGRWRDLLAEGVHLMGSTDYPYVFGELKTPIGIMASAVTRIGTLGDPPVDFMLNQTISPEQALRLLTIDGAYGTFQENIKGSIKFGKLADLVVLSDNPLGVPEMNLKDIEVLMTMIDGEIVYTKPDSSETTSVGPSSSISDPTTLPTTSTSRSTILTSTTSIPVFPIILALGLLISLKNTNRKT